MSDHEHFPAGSQGLFGVWQESALDDCVRRNYAVRDVLEHARKRERATARCLVRQRAGRVHTRWCTVAHFETYTGVYERLVEEHRCSAYGSAAVVSRPPCPRLVNLVPDPGQDGGEARLSASGESECHACTDGHGRDSERVCPPLVRVHCGPALPF